MEILAEDNSMPVEWRAECEDAMRVVVLQRRRDDSWFVYAKEDGPVHGRTFSSDTQDRACVLWIARRWPLIALLEPGQIGLRDLERELSRVNAELAQLKSSLGGTG